MTIIRVMVAQILASTDTVLGITRGWMEETGTTMRRRLIMLTIGAAALRVQHGKPSTLRR